jgi:hypothetical protein
MEVHIIRVANISNVEVEMVEIKYILEMGTEKIFV